MKKPDVTPAQIVSLVGSLIAVLAAFGLPISETQSNAIISLVQIIAPILIASDAVIRHGRSRHKD